MSANIDYMKEADGVELKVQSLPQADMTREFVNEAMKMFHNTQAQHKDTFDKEFDKLKVGQARTREFNKITKLINVQTATDGSLTIEEGSELHKLLISASQDVPSTSLPPKTEAIYNDDESVTDDSSDELPLTGIEIDTKKLTYTKDELGKLLENIRLSVDDMNIINELQLQTVNRAVTQQYELFQIMKTLLKPLHDTKIGMARGIQGR